MGVSERRERERERRRQEILAAAAHVFAARGLDGASMDAIAAQAELGKATLYYYFSTKEELHSAVLAEGTERFFASLGKVGGEFDELWELVEEVLRAYVEFFSEHPELLWVTAPYLSHMRWTRMDESAGDPLPVAVPRSDREAGAALPPPSEPGHPPLAEEHLPGHLTFLSELDRLLEASPWAGRQGAFMGFLADVFVVLSQRVMAGREDEVEEQVALYVDLVRGYRE